MSISRTAMGAAWCRRVEQEQPANLRQFDDPLVGRMLDPMMAMMADAPPMREQLVSSLGPGVYAGQVMRTRYIDDVVKTMVAGGLSQVVILGAGLDTRAFRMPSLAAATVYELDLPEIQRYKQKRLAGLKPCARDVRFVPTDLAREPLAGVLDAAGLDRSRPVLFIWEGVTQYLPEAAVRATLAVVGGCAPGSAIVFTYIRRSALGEASLALAGATGQQLAAGEPWIFGIEPEEVTGFLTGFGLELAEDVGAEDFRSRYLEPIGRRLDLTRSERIAVAVVVGRD